MSYVVVVTEAGEAYDQEDVTEVHGPFGSADEAFAYAKTRDDASGRVWIAPLGAGARPTHVHFPGPIQRAAGQEPFVWEERA